MEQGATWAICIAAWLAVEACSTPRARTAPSTPPTASSTQSIESRTAPSTQPTKPRRRPLELPMGQWMTATTAGALLITTPARWSCDWLGPNTRAARSFTPGARTSCIVPAEFLTNLVFGCPDEVTTPLGTALASYDARGRLISYGPRPDYQTTYGWDDDDRPITRNGKSVSVTRTPDEIVYIEDGIRESLKLDEQSRPVALSGMLDMKLGWRGDALVSLHWALAGVDPIDATFGQCGERE